jgi:hypothetical protein
LEDVVDAGRSTGEGVVSNNKLVFSSWDLKISPSLLDDTNREEADCDIVVAVLSR